MTLLLGATDGGYDKTLGFVNDGKEAVSIVQHEQDDQHEGFGNDRRSSTKTPVLLANHLGLSLIHI